MKSTIRAALIAGAAFSMIAGTASYAQQTAPAAPAAKAQKPHHGMKRQHDPAAHAQRLRDALQLTSAQEPALQAFLGSMQRPRADRAPRQAERPANLTTPQRLDRQAARMAERQQRFAQRAEATKRFYAALTPAQQKAFDAMHQGRGGKRGHRMMGHGGRS